MKLYTGVNGVWLGIGCERVRLNLHILVTIHWPFLNTILKHSRSIVYIVIGIGVYTHTVIQSVYSLSILCVDKCLIYCIVHQYTSNGWVHYNSVYVWRLESCPQALMDCTTTYVTICMLVLNQPVQDCVMWIAHQLIRTLYTHTYTGYSVYNTKGLYVGV